MGKPIHVEIAIRARIEDVWRLTQSPDLHQRWDLRFTRITYLPRPDPAAAQRYRGWFTVEWPPCPPGCRAAARPPGPGGTA